MIMVGCASHEAHRPPSREVADDGNDREPSTTTKLSRGSGYQGTTDDQKQVGVWGKGLMMRRVPSKAELRRACALVWAPGLSDNTSPHPEAAARSYHPNSRIGIPPKGKPSSTMSTCGAHNAQHFPFSHEGLDAHNRQLAHPPIGRFGATCALKLPLLPPSLREDGCCCLCCSALASKSSTVAGFIKAWNSGFS